MLQKDLEKLIRLFEKSELVELEWERNKEKVCFKKQGAYPSPVVGGTSVSAPAVAAPAAAASPAVSVEVSGSEAVKKDSRYKEILCPFVGTFYASPSPDAPSYVGVGSTVKKGDVLCIVEAMKIMNEIEAEFSGKIVELLSKNGQAVQYGQPLFLIEPGN